MAWKNTDIPFDSDLALAYMVVDDVIKSAIQVCTEEQPKEEVAEAKYEARNIKWLMCKNFTTAKGLLQIEEYMKLAVGCAIVTPETLTPVIPHLKRNNGIDTQTWELHESWLHWTNYIEDEELQYSTRYHYRVRWSIPTSRKPIPRATANVYFIIEISKIKPDTLPIEVYFVIETNRFIHRPGECRFKEKWLKDVIESKVTLMETVNF